jgi:hypothetical protein
MRSFAALIIAGTVLASSAFAAPVDAPLAPGKPAGVKEAQQGGNGFLMLAGVAVVAGGIALVVSQGNSGNSIAVSTTTSAP